MDIFFHKSVLHGIAANARFTRSHIKSTYAVNLFNLITALFENMCSCWITRLFSWGGPPALMDQEEMPLREEDVNWVSPQQCDLHWDREVGQSVSRWIGPRDARGWFSWNRCFRGWDMLKPFETYNFQRSKRQMSNEMHSTNSIAWKQKAWSHRRNMKAPVLKVCSIGKDDAGARVRRAFAAFFSTAICASLWLRNKYSIVLDILFFVCWCQPCLWLCHYSSFLRRCTGNRKSTHLSLHLLPSVVWGDCEDPWLDTSSLFISCF